MCSLRLFVLFLIAATFGSAVARAEPACASDRVLTLEQMTARGSAHTIPKDLEIDPRELDFRSGSSVVVQSLPLGTAKTTGTHMSEGAALCSVRDRNGDWWLVVEDRITSEGYLGYIPAAGLEIRPAAMSAAERRRRPTQLPADATNSVDGLWTICGNWESSRCYMTFAFLQRGSRICGSYEHIGVANRIYRGRLAGRRNGNRIDIEYSCGRPSSYAMHWCPEDRVFKSDGWARTSFSLLVCEGKLYPELGDCAKARVEFGLVRHSLLKKESEHDSWLLECLADDNFPPTRLMSPANEPSPL